MDLYFHLRYKSLSPLDSDPPAVLAQNLNFVCLSLLLIWGEIFSNLPEILQCCCTFPVLLKQFWVDWLIECPRGSWRRAQDINFLPRTEKMSQGGKIHENPVKKWNYKVCGKSFFLQVVGNLSGHSSKLWLTFLTLRSLFCLFSKAFCWSYLIFQLFVKLLVCNPY